MCQGWSWGAVGCSSLKWGLTSLIGNWTQGSEMKAPKRLDHKPQQGWSRTTVLVFFEERIQQRGRESKAGEVSVRSKACLKGHMGELKERCTLKGEFKSFTRWKISGFSPTNHLAHVQIWSDSGPFQSVCASFRQDGFQHEGFWEVGRIYYRLVSPPFSDTWGSFLHTCGVRELLDLKNEKYVASLSFTQEELSSSLLLPYFYLEGSTGDKFQVLSLRYSYLMSQYYL